MVFKFYNVVQNTVRSFCALKRVYRKKNAKKIKISNEVAEQKKNNLLKFIAISHTTISNRRISKTFNSCMI